MARFLGRTKELHNKKANVGVLITNLGTPEAPTSAGLRNFLREFLSDPRVVEIPRVVWMIILHGIILRVRPKKSAALYKSVWTDEGSPLMVISKQQEVKIRQSLTEKYGDDVTLALAMRYGEPTIEKALNSFQESGVNDIVILPLYPQYSGPTTASTFDAVVKTIQKWRWIPSLRFISGYHDNPKYVKALAHSVTQHIEQHGKPDKLVLSYHGMPKLFLEQGDPYYCFCSMTTRLVTEELGFDKDDFEMTFQSRFGKAKWLKPYTDVTLEKLAQDGHKHIAIISPAFSADCLETLEELEHENRAVFMDAGGETYHYIPALNDDELHIEALVDVISTSINK
ncbi:ferrochelatase [Pseudocolwellia sp. AS88]|uniref:ferrochelatase n=1 Tax=Pseudocolwellia sp. AS88 TaxID=3063958 RepID=UPI0026ED160D|nr:ferrochelatase [Pseudocolwellia sp. AS88]MDO7085506.1 ferrochelatase [Pseudocolwellia sp. AS88]